MPHEPPERITRREMITRLARSAVIGAGLWLAGDTINLVRRNISRELGNERLSKKFVGRVLEYLKYDRWDSMLIDSRLDLDRWSDAILAAFHKHCPSDISDDQKQDYLLMIIGIVNLETRFRTSRRAEPILPTPTETTLNQLGFRNATTGPMETTVSLIMRENPEIRDEKSARELLNKIESGMDLSVKHFFIIESHYRFITPSSLRMQCILADWNAGEGSSIFAGIQHVLSQFVPFPTLREDGVRGNQTIQKIREVITRFPTQWKEMRFVEGDIEDIIREFKTATTAQLPSVRLVRFLKLCASTTEMFPPVPADKVIKHSLLPNGSSRKYSKRIFSLIQELQEKVVQPMDPNDRSLQ